MDIQDRRKVQRRLVDVADRPSRSARGTNHLRVAVLAAASVVALQFFHYLPIFSSFFGVLALLLVLNRDSRIEGRQQSSDLYDNRQRVAVMAVGSDAAVWNCDKEGNMSLSNDLLAEHFGYAAHGCDGLNLRDLVHIHERQRLLGLLTLGSGWQSERWRGIHKDGTERWFEGSAIPNRAPNGMLLGYTCSTHPLSRDAVAEQGLSKLVTNIHRRLESGLIHPVFQPILSVKSGRLVGAEALSRFPDSDQSPEQWFIDATAVGLSEELELAALRAAFAVAHELPDDIYVSFNLGPVTLCSPKLLECLEAATISPSRIVLEVTEHASISDYPILQPAIETLRALGIRLAVDDAGAGYASFRHILRLSPEFIKLDRSLITDIHIDPARRALAAAVVMFGLEMNATIVAEGVETVEELTCAQALGIDAAQGFLFGRPTATWATWHEWHRQGPLCTASAANAAVPAASADQKYNAGPTGVKPWLMHSMQAPSEVPSRRYGSL